MTSQGFTLLLMFSSTRDSRGGGDTVSHVTVLQRALTAACLPVQASVVSAGSTLFLGSMTTEAVCELLRQIDGIDVGMLGQYAATVRKVGVCRRCQGERR